MRKIQICIASFLQDDIIKLFLSAYIFFKCNAKEFNGHFNLIYWTVSSNKIQQEKQKRINACLSLTLCIH